ncbi:DUF3027 domain-containing protein [Pseudonocardia bannensis]|uniref:DUF3027 domain-containing protein n=1 Tax=Pseudonocardia bannensis TaxID=630973 RepID=A0A848DNJ0_9PSEU|nr:DUF3027 domain-containing protein [Pseudonocardia bannensis]NMH94115.1 DUF3027 domain-containing protein [Pseudonocardia bannensis]
MSAVPTLDPPRLLADAVALARSAAIDEAGTEIRPDAAVESVGEHLESRLESDNTLTHFFEARYAGYRGWRWAVTLACAGTGEPVTVNEVVLLPGPDALVAPTWVPWQERVRPGDLGVGDLLPTAPDDDRLVPAYLASDDPAVEEVAVEVGLGRTRVLSRDGRLEAAQRWQDGPHGPAAPMAKAAPATCGTCAFFVPLAGSLRAGFGVCANEYSPADGKVVSVEFGCGAHSDVVVEGGSPVHVAALVYDDGVDLEPAGS